MCLFVDPKPTQAVRAKGHVLIRVWKRVRDNNKPLMVVGFAPWKPGWRRAAREVCNAYGTVVHHRKVPIKTTPDPDYERIAAGRIHFFMTRPNALTPIVGHTIVCYVYADEVCGCNYDSIYESRVGCATRVLYLGGLTKAKAMALPENI